MLVGVEAESGLLATRSEPRPLRAHDFWHTCATRKARLGWNESQLRRYFGWSPGSDMPSRYVHLALGDMREQVRRDAGVDEWDYQRIASPRPGPIGDSSFIHHLMKSEAPSGIFGRDHRLIM